MSKKYNKKEKKHFNDNYYAFKKQLGYCYACFFLTNKEKLLIRGVLKSGRRENIFAFIAKALARAQEDESKTREAGNE